MGHYYFCFFLKKAMLTGKSVCDCHFSLELECSERSTGWTLMATGQTHLPPPAKSWLQASVLPLPQRLMTSLIPTARQFPSLLCTRCERCRGVAGKHTTRLSLSLSNWSIVPNRDSKSEIKRKNPNPRLCLSALYRPRILKHEGRSDVRIPEKKEYCFPQLLASRNRCILHWRHSQGEKNPQPLSEVLIDLQNTGQGS